MSGAEQPNNQYGVMAPTSNDRSTTTTPLDSQSNRSSGNGPLNSNLLKG